MGASRFRARRAACDRILWSGSRIRPVIACFATRAGYQAWTSRGLVRPQPAAIVNGVVFALSAGTVSSPAVLYALDPATGNEIWTSGNTITSFATAGLSTGTGQLFVVTHDNTVWSFGIPLPN